MLQEHLQESSVSKSLLVITNGDDAYPLNLQDDIQDDLSDYVC